MNESAGRIGLNHPKVMGDFPGHALPGSFFIIAAFWWSTMSTMKFLYKKQKQTSYLISQAFFRKAGILEGIVIVGMTLMGIIGVRFVAGKPHLTTDKEIQFDRIIFWQHITMYLFFGMLGVTKILCFTITSLPVSLTKLMFTNALFVEAFIFHNHTHGREMLDSFGHQLLSFSMFLAGLLAFLECLVKNNILLELLRSSFVMLHGIWFWQIAFILFPHDKAQMWDLSDHSNSMFLSIYFCLHYALANVLIVMNYTFVTWFLKWRLRKLCPPASELLKNSEEDQESEAEM